MVKILPSVLLIHAAVSLVVLTGILRSHTFGAIQWSLLWHGLAHQQQAMCPASVLWCRNDGKKP